jgi:hypothetical protein
LTPGYRDALIARYVEGVDVFSSAVDLVPASALDRRGDDGWTIRQVVHHLADAEMIASTPVRRLVAETEVSFVSYDEDLWSRTAHYERPIESALALIRGVRENTAEFLRALSDEEWQRAGSYSNYTTPYTPTVWLEYYAAHAHDHGAKVDSIRQAAEAS